MTTATIRYQKVPSFNKIFATVILLFLVVAIGIIYLSPYASAKSTPIYISDETDTLLAVNATIIEIVNSHAWENHGTEVNAAFRCLNNNGSTRSFQTFGFKDERGNPIKTNLWLCFDNNSWYAIVTTTLEKIGGNRIGRLITAYKIDTTLFPTIESFILKIRDLWFAKEITFQILKDTVHLAPK